MSLPHALLTALIEQSSSGSELARRFDRSIGFFWSATHQQIYRELGRLEEAGWVSASEAEGRGGKKTYKVLAAGRRELRRWAAAGGDPRSSRDQLMVRLRAEAVIGPTGLREDIALRLQAHRERLALYRRLEESQFLSREQSQQDRIHHLILSAGIMTEALWVDWSQQALAVLDGAPPEPAAASAAAVSEKRLPPARTRSRRPAPAAGSPAAPSGRPAGAAGSRARRRPPAPAG